MSSSIRTLEQERAKRAWECVQQVKGEPFAGDYRTIAVKAPSLILTNGLGQTLAFLHSKRERDSHRLLYKHLSEWVAQKLGVQGNDVLQWIAEDATVDQYRRATTEALAFLQWLKRFAEAELPKGREE